MERFNSYEIRQVGETNGIVEPLNGDDPQDFDNTYWTLYGHTDGLGVVSLVDCHSYQSVRELYYAISGHDCGENAQDHFNLPTGGV